MITTTAPITAARAAALFVSSLSATDQPTYAEAETAIRHALLTHGSVRGCVADVAASYGDYPELAASRMRWARTVVESLYAHQARPRGRTRTRPIGVHRRLVSECLAVAA
ncbi:MAG: hypothetical protein AUI14_06090 [Actinobacteria bacterium 13_2_20CM_2_71_6]|nr:MAG: hypothetical protein AUI14_06090 [Actinobacteria bacterium 13_2_20CM_2_71_6]